MNEWLDEEKLQEAKSTLESSLATDSLLQTNEKKYKMLRDGIPVEMAREDGTSETFHAQVFDCAAPREEPLRRSRGALGYKARSTSADATSSDS